MANNNNSIVAGNMLSGRTEQIETDGYQVRSALQIFEDTEDYSCKPQADSNQVTTPTLNHIGSDKQPGPSEFKKMIDSECTPLQFKAASTSAILPSHQVRNPSTSSMDYGRLNNLGGVMSSGANQRKGIRIYQPTGNQAEDEAQILFCQSEHQSQPPNGAGGIMRSQSTVSPNNLPPTRNIRKINMPNRQNQSNITSGGVSMSSFMPSAHMRSMDTSHANIGAKSRLLGRDRPPINLSPHSRSPPQIGAATSRDRMQPIHESMPSGNSHSTFHGHNNLQRPEAQRAVESSNREPGSTFKQEKYAQIFNEALGNNRTQNNPSGNAKNETNNTSIVNDSRRANLNLLDQNFQHLMDQNQKLEQEIRQMNTQFTQKQNERIALVNQQACISQATFSIEKETPRTIVPLPQQPPIPTALQSPTSQALTSVSVNNPAEASIGTETKEATVTVPAIAMSQAFKEQIHLESDKFNISRMQGDFDERCARTKQIVTQLATRLHEVKLDTYTQMDKINQSRQLSQSSDANSRSPNPGTVIKRINYGKSNSRDTSARMPAASGPISQPLPTRPASKNSSTHVAHPMPMNINKQNVASAMYRDTSSNGPRNSHTRNSTNERFNCSAVIGKISPIQANNDASVNSTRGGFNFRKLKPHDESQTSFAEVKTNGAQSTNQDLCFDNSPLKGSMAGRIVKKSALSPKSGSRNNVTHLSAVSGEPQSTGEGMLSTVAQSQNKLNAAEAPLQDIKKQKAQQLQQKTAQEPHKTDFNSQHSSNTNPAVATASSAAKCQEIASSSWQDQSMKELNLVGQNGRQITSLNAEETTPATIAQGTGKIGGPDRSPGKVTGNQLSNILHQINGSSTNAEALQKNDLPLQQKQTEVVQDPQVLLLPPNKTASGEIYLSQDAWQHQGPSQQEVTSQFAGQHSAKVGLSAQQQAQLGPLVAYDSSKLQTIIVAPTSAKQLPTAAENGGPLTQLRSQLMQQQNQEHGEVLSSYNDDGATGQHQTVEGMSQSTYDRMHIDILHLQDKIRYLESQMITSPSLKNEPHGNIGDFLQQQTPQHKQQLIQQRPQPQPPQIQMQAEPYGQSQLQQESMLPHPQSMETHTIDSGTVSIPYKHDSKHMHLSSRASILKMNVPKTVMVQPQPEGTVLMATSKSNQDLSVMEKSSHYQQDQTSLTQRAPFHRNLHSESLGVSQKESKRAGSRRAKSRSQAENSLLQITENIKKHSADNLLSVAAQREHKEKFVPLKREMYDIMSHSQPDLQNLRKSRRQQSVKTISRLGSGKSSKIIKSPLSKSQKSSRRQKNATGSSKADQKTLASQYRMNSKHRHNASVSSQKAKDGVLQQSKRSKSRGNLNSTIVKQGERHLDSTPAHGVSFRETAEEIDDSATPVTRERRRTTGDQNYQQNNAYECTDSGYSEGENSEQDDEILTTNRGDASQTPHGGEKITSVEQSALQTDTVRRQMSTERSPDEREGVSSISKRSALKQTFPLRVRKNQTFAKGPECASIPSSRTQVVERFAVDSQDMSEQPPINSNNHRSLLGSVNQDNCSFSEMPSNTFQDDILREYENQILNNQQVKASRNSGLPLLSSEIQKVRNDAILNNVEQTFEHPLARPVTQSNDVKYNATNFSHQTSHFQAPQHDQSSNEKPQEYVQIVQPMHKSSFKTYQEKLDNHANLSHFVEIDLMTSSNKEDGEDCEEEDQESEHRIQPLQPKRQSSKDRRRKENLPLQQQQPRSGSRHGDPSPTTAAKRKAAQKSRVAFLEQRNRHLELELKRHQVHLAKSDELHQKYKGLKVDYKQLTQSFERSEDIRREQKELITEQRGQLRNFKAQACKQLKKIDDLTCELDLAKQAGTSHSDEHLIGIPMPELPLQQNHQRQSRSSRQLLDELNNISQPMLISNQAYIGDGDSGDEHSHSESHGVQQQSSHPSQHQLSRSFNNNSAARNYVISSATSYGLSHPHGELPLQLQQSHNSIKQPAMIMSQGGYLPGQGSTGLGMLDLAQVAGSTDDFFPQHDGYSVIHDQSTGGPTAHGGRHHLSSKGGNRRRAKRSQSALSEKSNRNNNSKTHHKKSHKKKHRKSKHQHEHSHQQRQNDDRSLSTARKSRSKSAQRRSKQFASNTSTGNYHFINPNADSEILSMQNLSIQKKKKRRSKSRKKQRSRMKQENDMIHHSSSYIFNIQTDEADLMKGVHKYAAGSGTSKTPSSVELSARQHRTDSKRTGTIHDKSRSNSGRSREKQQLRGSQSVIKPFYC